MSQIPETPDQPLADHPELADVDERALRGLLTRAHQPPEMRPAARASILVALKKKQAATFPRPTAPIAVAPTAVRPTALKPRARTRAAAWVAALAAAALLALWVRGASQPVMHHNGATEPLVVTLVDGSTLVLDAGAKVIERGSHELELVNGRALVDVVPGAAYVLSSSHGRLVGDGARFVVTHDAASTVAAVARGEVRAVSGDRAAQVTAGQQAVLAAGKAPVRASARRLSYLVSWARETLQAQEPAEVRPIRRGNLEARIPDSEVSWPLPMRNLTVDVVVEDGVVRTTFDHTFFNHQNRDLEGMYTFSLPSDAAVSRLAMYVDGTLMEGGIVERGRGRNIYEDIVYRRRDPALLEWMSGNELSVRIFPLPARTEKRILLSYTQVMPRLYDTRRLVVPIPQLDHPVDHVHYRVRVADGARFHLGSTSHALAIGSDGSDRLASFEADDYRVGTDLVLTLKEKEPLPSEVVTFTDASHRYLLARVQPDLAAESEARRPQDWVVLFDTSASRSPGEIEAQERMLSELVTELDTHDRVAVIAFDATQRVMPGGFHRVYDVDPGELASFFAAQTRDGVGHTDLGSAVLQARELLASRAQKDRKGNLLYLGDGVPTAGERDAAALRGLIDGITFVGVGVGDRADSGALRDLAAASDGAFVQVTPDDDLAWRAFDLVATLNTPRLAGVHAELHDATGDAIAGEIHVSAQAAAGEDITVIARLPKNAEPAVLAIGGTTSDGAWSERLVVGDARTGGQYLPRLWARRHIEALVREDSAAHRESIITLGLDNFLVTPFTSLLVLETEADYVKHKVVRPATDAWARYAAPAKVEVVREPFEAPAIPFGSVVLRHPATTGRGFGSGHGRLGGKLETRTLVTGPRPPRVRMGWTGMNAFETTIVDIPRLTRNPFGVDNGVLLPRMPWGNIVDDNRRGWRQTARGDVDNKSTGADRWSTLKTASKGTSGRFRNEAGVFALRDADIERWGGADGAWVGVAHIADLSAFVPELFADAIDHEREATRQGRTPDRAGSISDEARVLLDAAVRPIGHYRGSSGEMLSVHAHGLSLNRTTSMGLREMLSVDGTTLRGAYPDLRIATARDVDGAPLASIEHFAPIVAPTVDRLTDHDVRLEGERELRIAPLGTGTPLLLTFDEDGRVVRWQRGVRVTEVTWSATSVVLETEGSDPIELERVAREAAPFPSTEDATWTKVSLPLRDLAFAQKRVDEAKVGSAAWRTALRQVLATQLALGTRSWQPITQLRKAGLTPTRGELVLASRSVPANASTWLGDLDDPVAAFLRDVLREREGKDTSKRDTDSAPGFMRIVRTHRRLFRTWGGFDAQWQRYRQLVAYGVAPAVRVAALTHISRYASPKTLDDVVNELDQLAVEPSVRERAGLEAAHLLHRVRRHEESAQRLEAVIASADARMRYLDAGALHTARVALPNGVDTFRRWMLQRRDRLVRVGTPAALVAAASMLDQFGTPADLEVVMNVVGRTDVTDAGAAYQLASILTRRGFLADAERLVRGHIDSGPNARSMLALAAQIAENDHRYADADGFLRKLMDDGEGMLLSERQRLYRRRFELLIARARALSLPHIDDALAVAAAWRKEDPDNAEIDKLCFGALTARGDHLGAYRHLSSIIERHPAVGSAYADVAQQLRSQGRLLEAELNMLRAIDVEPTNPTWLLQHAEILDALSKPDAAKAVLEQVAKGNWQDRFANEVNNAKRRLTSRTP